LFRDGAGRFPALFAASDHRKLRQIPGSETEASLADSV
jgi:hypothetical protein